jgi:hypothetical protein
VGSLGLGKCYKSTALVAQCYRHWWRSVTGTGGAVNRHWWRIVPAVVAQCTCNGGAVCKGATPSVEQQEAESSLDTR